eukprot:10970767-Lingulodinium_polyedra.AAC.1
MGAVDPRLEQWTSEDKDANAEELIRKHEADVVATALAETDDANKEQLQVARNLLSKAERNLTEFDSSFMGFDEAISDAVL